MGFFKFILSFFFGPVVSMFTKTMDYRTQKAIVDGQVMQESIRADIEIAKVKKEINEINNGWWATRWIVPGFAYPLIVWWTCIIADSVYQFPNWNVAALPAPLDEWAGQIIMSFFIVRGAEIIGNSIGKASLIDRLATTVKSIFSKK